MSDVLHVSSLLLRAQPDQVADIIEHIEAMEGAEAPVTDPSGKIIVTLETDSEAAIVAQLNTLSLLDGVVSAALVYHETMPLHVQGKPADGASHEPDIQTRRN